MKSEKKNILIYGGGFVGITLAGKLLSKKTNNVVIVENNSLKYRGFGLQQYGVFEPGLDDILNKAVKKSKLKFETKLPDYKFDICFICIGTPRNENLDASLNSLKIIINDLIGNLAFGGHVYLRSTVQVGTTSNLVNDIMKSNRKDIKIFYAPERTAEGVALKELDLLPQILGASNNHDLSVGQEMLSNFGFNVLLTSSTEEAEFIKLICNVWRDSVFAISNELAVFAENLKIDIGEAINKANMDYPRSNIPFPGPVGGPCLSKDTYILLESLNSDLRINSLVLAARQRNESVPEIVFERISNFIDIKSSEQRIIFLGSAFKGQPKTNDFRESLTKNVIDRLIKSELSIKISIWDPTVEPRDLLEYSNYHIHKLDPAAHDIVIIGNNNDSIYTDNVIEFLSNLGKNNLLIDMWGVTRKIKAIQCNLYIFGNGVNNK